MLLKIKIKHRNFVLNFEKYKINIFLCFHPVNINEEKIFHRFIVQIIQLWNINSEKTCSFFILQINKLPYGET